MASKLFNQTQIEQNEQQVKQMKHFQQTKKGKAVQQIPYQEVQTDQNSIQETKKTAKEILQEKFNKKKEAPVVITVENHSPQKEKELRDWGVSTKVTKKTMQQLEKNPQNQQQSQQAQTHYFSTTEEDEKILAQFDKVEDKTKNNQNFFSKLTSKVKSYTGNKVIQEQDIDQILENLMQNLLEKNMTEQVCKSLISSVKANLLETKTLLFTSLYQTVKQSLQESLTKILSNPYHLIPTILSSKKPFVITFIGVNGVGKSTTLSKIAYLLQQNGLSLLMAACDNFRAGAIEQLGQHAKNLNIPLYERGYKLDPASIAQGAIQQATSQKKDVVLIDTAGRMQDNEPLMKALARLVQVNRPDLVIFIGEALAGGDCVDQLVKFDKALNELGGRGIDAVVLSKFDTVDDKSNLIILVGQAINLTYTTGKPILYVGVGQKYPHLRKLNAQIAVNSLLL